MNSTEFKPASPSELESRKNLLDGIENLNILEPDKCALRILVYIALHDAWKTGMDRGEQIWRLPIDEILNPVKP